jgi:hypothetical protein
MRAEANSLSFIASMSQRQSVSFSGNSFRINFKIWNDQAAGCDSLAADPILLGDQLHASIA